MNPESENDLVRMGSDERRQGRFHFFPPCTETIENMLYILSASFITSESILGHNGHRPYTIRCKSLLSLIIVDVNNLAPTSDSMTQAVSRCGHVTFFAKFAFHAAGRLSRECLDFHVRKQL